MTHRLAALAARHIVPATLVATALIGVADYWSGVAITFVQLTYLLPIAFATWRSGRVLGVVLACVATLCASVLFAVLDGVISPFPLVLNAAGCFGMYLFVIWMLDRLRHHVEREQLQRRAAVEQLRHADRLHVIGVLAAGVAHELGTPLNVIAGTAELLEGEPAAATTILHQTDKINAIIKHLLAFGRSTSSARDVVELDRVAWAAAELLGSTARKRGATIEIEPPPLEVARRVRVRAADSQVEQVLSNLLLNAIQAMPRGGTVRVRTGVETRADADGVTRRFGSVAVEDEGTGIADADLARIFDPFFTTKGVGEGTGLGLSVSYGIVHDHGGTIEVTSAAGRGTSFVVLLPLAA